jgi:hypothetical protein
MGIDQDFDLELRIGENGKRNETNIQEKSGILIEPSHQLCGGVARWGPSIEKKRT